MLCSKLIPRNPFLCFSSPLRCPVNQVNKHKGVCVCAVCDGGGIQCRALKFLMVWFYICTVPSVGPLPPPFVSSPEFCLLWTAAPPQCGWWSCGLSRTPPSSAHSAAGPSSRSSQPRSEHTHALSNVNVLKRKQ